MLQSGAQVDGFRIIEPLGHGGMSSVYRARDEAHQRDVTLKFPNPEMMGDPATYERFRREVKIGKLLEHPNIQKLYEIGGDSRVPYLVLEFVPGQSLRAELRRDQEQPAAQQHPWQWAAAIGAQVARALEYAHANHVFHRDLKPENIIVTPDGEAKVMDFGIAFVEGARRITWGALSSQIGTPDYMAPEQIKGSRGDHRTDIYALGMILYECAAHRLPYDGDNSLSVMSQHVNVSPPPLSSFVPEVAPALEEAVMKAIRRNPDLRWPTMHDFLHALDHPETVDVEALREERLEHEAAVSRGTVSEFAGLPPWQVALMAVGIVLLLAVLVVLVQLLHGPIHG